MSGFVTRIDYSTNRQIKQRAYTSTDLSGTTVFGLEYSALTAGVDLETVVITSTLANVETTFSGNSQETIFNFPDARMVVASGSLTVITDANSGVTQNAIAFEGSEWFELDNNIVNTAYTGSSFDLTVTEIVDDGLSGWTGTANSTLVQFLSGSSLDFQDRAIWVDVKGITKTGQLIIAYQPNKDNSLQSVLGRTAEGDVVEVDLTQLDTVYEGTYTELQTLIDNNELKIGNKYILTDYLGIYQIENTSTSPILEKYTINGNASGWAYFDPGIPEESLGLYDWVTISALPYPISGLYVGQSAQVTTYFNIGYMRFTPSLLTAGIEIAVNKQRNPQIPNDDIIYDDYGNIIMKPNGVINIDVHNDLPYMNMTSIENESPKLERILLTAIDVNKFSINAESLTHLGELLTYYFTDNKVYDENGVFIRDRNGFITKRTSKKLNISVDKDWRVQKYRRWLMEPDIWSGYTLTQDVYKVNGRNICTTVNVLNDEHKYILLKPYQSDFYLDFASGTNTYGGLNPFISGTTVAPSRLSSGRSTNDHAPEYTVDVQLSYSGLTKAKDFNIFPINNGEVNNIVTEFNVNSISNSIFLMNTNRYGSSGSISINSIASIYQCSFMTGFFLKSSGGNISNVTSIDSLYITLGGPTSDINKSHMFRFGGIVNNGILRNITLGSSRDNFNDYAIYKFDSTCIVLNSIFGDIRGDDTTFNNLFANKLLYKFRFGGNCSIKGKMYLTQLESNLETWSSTIEVESWNGVNPATGKYGYYYPIVGDINGKYVHNLLGNKNLIHEYSDSLNVIQLITKSTLQ